MRVILRHPRREIEVAGPRRVHALLADLDLVPEGHLVICDDELVPSDALLPADAVVEVRPVISGGS